MGLITSLVLPNLFHKITGQMTILIEPLEDDRLTYTFNFLAKMSNEWQNISELALNLGVSFEREHIPTGGTPEWRGVSADQVT